jgi:hypothetical protein
MLLYNYKWKRREIMLNNNVEETFVFDEEEEVNVMMHPSD